MSPYKDMTQLLSISPKSFLFWVKKKLCVLVPQSHLTLCNPMDCWVLIRHTRHLCVHNSPGKNTGVGCHFHIPKVFLIWGKKNLPFQKTSFKYQLPKIRNKVAITKYQSNTSRATKRRGGETKIVISKYTVFVPTVTHGLKIQNLEQCEREHLCILFPNYFQKFPQHDFLTHICSMLSFPARISPQPAFAGGIPGWLSDKESTCQSRSCRSCRCNP